MAQKASVSNPGIQKSWLNLIMHLTAIIAERKQDLGSAHLLRTVIDVFIVIFLEGVLAIVSIPIYFAAGTGHFSRENDFYIQYRIRKYITFLLLVLISVVFVLKLCVTFWITFSFQEAGSADVKNPERSFAGMEIINSEISDSVPPPMITGNIDGATLITGKAGQNGKVVVFVSALSGGNPKEMLILSANADAGGNWKIPNNGNILPGLYTATAVSVDETGRLRSAESIAFNLTVQPTIQEMANDILDRLLGFLVFLFIGIGFIVVILTI